MTLEIGRERAEKDREITMTIDRKAQNSVVGIRPRAENNLI